MAAAAVARPPWLKKPIINVSQKRRRVFPWTCGLVMISISMHAVISIPG